MGLNLSPAIFCCKAVLGEKTHFPPESSKEEEYASENPYNKTAGSVYYILNEMKACGLCFEIQNHVIIDVSSFYFPFAHSDP